jgi:hypothetical protein
MKPINWSRAIMAAVAAFVVAQLGFIILFGNPIVHSWFYTAASGQSAKFVAVWNTLQPLPPLSAKWSDLGVVTARTYVTMGLLLFWTLCVTLVYAVVSDCLPGKGWHKGISAGVMVWAIAFVFFGSFFHFNVLNMPIIFVLGEWVLEAVISIASGVTIAAIYKPAR